MSPSELIAKLRDLDWLYKEDDSFRALFLGVFVSRTALYSIRINEIELAFPGMRVIYAEINGIATHARIADNSNWR